MEGGQMNLTLYTVCNGKESEKVVRQVSQPELIKNLQCYVYADKKANCSWLPASPALDLKFYYLLSSWDSSRSVDECFSYKDTDGIRTGCHLDVSFQDNIFIIFNGTLNNTPAWNTFSRRLNDDVRPPPLIWTVTKSDGKLNISWTPLNIHGLHWKYIINYHECDELKTKTTDGPVTSAVVDVVPHCPYRICVKAKSDGGETPCDKEKLFDADADPAAWVYAAIIIPLLFACLAVLIIVCCRKNKEVIFPKIPEPRNLLSDISDNNNKITVRNLYIPAEEEENCKITLVHEP
ncbi:interleukin-13 receptor subunit alpha-1 isoform X2 [Centropristis striata]|nr:interleukin-13 receptor subunit alpha-1 isoform X2 [Centropristis striata]